MTTNMKKFLIQISGRQLLVVWRLWMLLCVFLFSSEVMLEKQFTGHRVDRFTCAWFWDQILTQGDSLKLVLVFASSTHYLFQVVREGLTFLACTQVDMPPLMAIEFLCRVADVLTDYLDGLNEDLIKDNFVIVYELLEEIDLDEKAAKKEDARIEVGDDVQAERLNGGKGVIKEESEVEKEAWRLLRNAVVTYCGSPVGTVAANDPNDKLPLIYDPVFTRDFIPPASAFLLKGDGEIVRNFLLHTLQLQKVHVVTYTGAYNRNNRT